MEQTGNRLEVFAAVAELNKRLYDINCRVSMCADAVGGSTPECEDPAGHEASLLGGLAMAIRKADEIADHLSRLVISLGTPPPANKIGSEEPRVGIRVRQGAYSGIG